MGYDILNAEAFGIDVNADYEISFEAEEDGAGGVNLGVFMIFMLFRNWKSWCNKCF